MGFTFAMVFVFWEDEKSSYLKGVVLLSGRCVRCERYAKGDTIRNPYQKLDRKEVYMTYASYLHENGPNLVATGTGRISMVFQNIPPEEN